MTTNTNNFDSRDKDGGIEVGSPHPFGRISTDGSSCTDSNQSDLLPPPPAGDDLSETSSTHGANFWTSTKIFFVITIVCLLFGAGTMAGLTATGAFFGGSTVSTSVDEGNSGIDIQTTSGNSTDSPSALTIQTAISNPTAVPTNAPVDEIQVPTPLPTTALTDPPTESHTRITADATRVPIPRPPSSGLAADGTYDYRSHSDFLVGAYYYPWYGKNFHNGAGYIRKELVPRHHPLLGEYDDTDPQIIAEHMKMFRRANIGLLVTSWWGPNKLEDNTTMNVLMEHKDVGNLKISLFYETVGRLLNGNVDGVVDIANAKADIEYMCEHYFNHPNYYKVDGRPVLFIYLARLLKRGGALEEALLIMRSEANKRGHNIFLVGDYSYNNAPKSTEDEPYIPFWYLDAITNFDMYGGAGRPKGHAGHDAVSLYYEQQAQWKESAKENCKYIPAVSPGYNDRGVRLESNNPAMSRRLTADSEEGSLFHFQLKHAKKLADPRMDNLILVNSFNEWHEDTQIEPVAVANSAVWPPVMTQDLEYVAYSNLYLDILGASTVNRDNQGIFDYLYEY